MNRGKRTIAAIVCAAMAATAAPATADSRLVKHQYDPDEVVQINGKLGVQATIAFEEEESIENVAVGDSTKWQITPNKRANLLFVKPLGAAARTNMTVVTDKRTYFFDLVASARANPVYLFRFAYGEPAPVVSTPVIQPPPSIAALAEIAPKVVNEPMVQPTQAEVAPVPEAAEPAPMVATPEPGATPAPPASPEPDLAALTEDERAMIDFDPVAEAADPAVLNFAWTRKGDAALLPSRVYDDGSSTYLLWDEDQSVPAILVRNEQGEEGPVNYAVRGQTIVLDDVPSLIVLRTGDASATLENLNRSARAGDAAPRFAQEAFAARSNRVQPDHIGRN